MNDYVLVYLLTYKVVLQKNGIINEVKPENISISFNCLTTRWQWHLLSQRFKNYLDKVCNIRHAHCMGKASTWTKVTKEVPGWISGDSIWYLLHVPHFLKWINAILLWFQNKKKYVWKYAEFHSLKKTMYSVPAGNHMWTRTDSCGQIL